MNPSIRIGLSIAALTVCIFLSADFFFKILPSEHGPLLEARKKLCESIAVQFSTLLEKDQKDTIQKTMHSLVKRNPDIISIGVRLNNGTLLASAGNHEAAWTVDDTGLSTPTHARVPIFRNEKVWGKIEVHFTPLTGTFWSSILKSPLFRLIVITLTFGLLVYVFFIRRTLNYLDPSAVIPGRVKTALDQLVEGVVLLDENSKIVLANTAFSKMLRKPIENLLGLKLSSLPWDNTIRVENDHAIMPWDKQMASNAQVTDIRLMLRIKDDVRVLSTNVSPIKDGNGEKRGTLVTFDDISEIERKNNELKKTIEQLENAKIKIKAQNDELRRLATVDPLSGALNRRAFFEKLGLEFALARQEKLILSCLMVDIDHFKQVNDSYGHSVGDDMIKGMSNILLENCPTNGAVGRYGGEEFCLVLPGLSDEEAYSVAENIRVQFSEWSSKPESPTSGKQFTASFGLSSITTQTKDAATIIDQADQALYVSKQSGRNQTTSWFDLSEPNTKAG